MQAFKFLQKFFTGKSKPIQSSYSAFSTESNVPPEERGPKLVLLQETLAILDKGGNIPHDLLSALVFAHYDFKIERAHYRLRRTNESLLMFEIAGVDIITSRHATKLEDVLLTLHEISLNTSLELRLSVRDYLELLEPIKFNQ